MSGGPITSFSLYLGGAAGVLTSIPYIPATNTNSAGATEGIGCAGGSSGLVGGADAPAVLQFLMPPAIPTGTIKLRLLGMANATSGTAKINIKDGRTPAGSSIGVATLTTESGSPTISQTWATADILVENKIALTGVGSLAGNDIVTVVLVYTNSGWSLNGISTQPPGGVWLPSIIWE